MGPPLAGGRGIVTLLGMTPRLLLTLVVLALILAGAAALRLAVGEPGVSLATPGVLELRTHRVLLAVIVGAGLAGSGVALQSLLRNPLAEPFVLGLSSGAALGVMAQMLTAHYLARPRGDVHYAAFLGAAASMGVVYLAGRRRGIIDPLGLLLVGVVLGTINGALIMLLNYLPAGPVGLREDVFRWMMGSLNEAVSTRDLGIIGGLTLAGLIVLWVHGRAMDVAGFSDEEALALGVNLRRLRVTLFLTASLLAAGAVMLGGPLAFVGLICPHLVRLILGPTHRSLLPGSALLGSALILLADALIVLADRGQGRMPLGVFTALLGGPVFIALLRPTLGRP